jgi:hypothetical protein
MKTIQEMIAARQQSITRDMPSFLKGPTPYSVLAFVNRNNTNLPTDFVPWAPGIVLPSEYLLRAARQKCGRGSQHRPKGWSSRPCNSFAKSVFGNFLKVSQCGQLWGIERDCNEALVFRFGSMPVFTQTSDDAMLLVEYCHPRARRGERISFPEPRDLASNFRWVPSTPGGIMFC